jgi:hypothetical protein
VGLVRLQLDDDAASGAERFNLWRFPGRKMLIHGGGRLVLTGRLGYHTIRIAIDQRIGHGKPVVYAIPVTPGAAVHWRAVEQLRRIVTAALNDTLAVTLPRPSRKTLFHLRCLQALDGALAGATQRQVAEVLFDRDTVVRQWHVDSQLRAQVRHWLRRGRALMAGEYRQLLVERATAASD